MMEERTLSPQGEAKMVYECIKMLREDRKEGMECDMNIARRGGKFFIENVEWKSDESVRVDWKNMANRVRLRAEEPGLDCEPLYDSVILRPFDMKAFTRTSLALPDGVLSKTKELFSIFKEMPLQGIVVAVGPGWVTESGVPRVPPVEIGDHVGLKHAIGASDFIYRGVLYYDTKATNIAARYPESYTNSIIGLKYDTGTSKN